MACELIDKIVVHEAIGKKPNRQQQVDIYYNFIGQFDLPLSEKEGVTEALKAENQMLWAQRMNNIRSAAMEIVSSKLIYC